MSAAELDKLIRQMRPRHPRMFWRWWRRESKDGTRYQMNVNAGSPDWCAPCWAKVYPVNYPQEKALDEVAEWAFNYFAWHQQQTYRRPPLEQTGPSG